MAGYIFQYQSLFRVYAFHLSCCQGSPVTQYKSKTSALWSGISPKERHVVTSQDKKDPSVDNRGQTDF